MENFKPTENLNEKEPTQKELFEHYKRIKEFYKNVSAFAKTDSKLEDIFLDDLDKFYIKLGELKQEQKQSAVAWHALVGGTVYENDDYLKVKDLEGEYNVYNFLVDLNNKLRTTRLF